MVRSYGAGAVLRCGCGFKVCRCGFNRRCGFEDRCGCGAGAGAVWVRAIFFAHFGVWL